MLRKPITGGIILLFLLSSLILIVTSKVKKTLHNRKYRNILSILLILNLPLASAIYVQDIQPTYNPVQENDKDYSYLPPDGLVLPSYNAQALPLLSSLFKHRGINISVEWGKGELLEFEDISSFSSLISLDYWSVSDQAIVVNSYQDALLASQITSLLDIPILFYGDTTNSAIVELQVQTVIEIGETPVDGDIVLSGQQDVIEYTLDLAQNLNITIDYLVVTNPCDQGVQVDNLSAFSSLLAAYRNGIICTCTNNSQQINRTIKDIYKVLENRSICLKYVCLVGDPLSIPFSIIELDPQYQHIKFVATDNIYADLDGNSLTPEIAIGRFLTKDLADASALFDRYVHYTSYFDDKQPSSLNWQSTAWACMLCPLGKGTIPQAILAIFLDIYGNLQNTLSTYRTFRQSGFRTLRPIAPIVEIASELSEQSNYIFFPGIHGCPYAVFGYDINEIDFHPSVVFMVSCSAGRTDNVTLNQSVTAGIFHSGLATFISATRDAWSNDIGRDGLGNCLGRLFFEQLVRNESVGTALLEAKNLYNNLFKDNEQENIPDKITLYEFVLYSDPAFNPYEPRNEGKIK